MPQAERQAAVAVARQFDYADANQRQQLRRDQRAAGDCSHGIARECCPCGCDDIDDACDDMDFSAANCLGDLFDQLLAQLREEWDAMKSRVEWEISCAVRPFTGGLVV